MGHLLTQPSWLNAFTFGVEQISERTSRQGLSKARLRQGTAKFWKPAPNQHNVFGFVKTMNWLSAFLLGVEQISEHTNQ